MNSGTRFTVLDRPSGDAAVALLRSKRKNPDFAKQRKEPDLG